MPLCFRYAITRMDDATHDAMPARALHAHAMLDAYVLLNSAQHAIFSLLLPAITDAD